jgi:hypothetical protein
VRCLTLLKDLNEHQRKLVDRYYENQYSIGIGHKEKIKKNAKDLIAIAGGKEKQNSILAAIKTGLIKTLITDQKTAIWLFCNSLEHGKTDYKQGILSNYPYETLHSGSEEWFIKPNKDLKRKKCGHVLQNIGAKCQFCKEE